MATYTDAFTRALLVHAEADPRIVAITAAMPGPTGLLPFQARFPDRFLDVGIAEQHAVTAAAGMAMAGMRPVVAVYSTFFSRAFDQANLDVGLHRLPVVFVLDRAGITGDDGPSHHGVLDLALCLVDPGDDRVRPVRRPTRSRSCSPTALTLDGPSRHPLPEDAGPGGAAPDAVGSGLDARLVRDGDGSVCLLAVGKMVAGRRGGGRHAWPPRASTPPSGTPGWSPPPTPTCWPTPAGTPWWSPSRTGSGTAGRACSSPTPSSERSQLGDDAPGRDSRHPPGLSWPRASRTGSWRASGSTPRRDRPGPCRDSLGRSDRGPRPARSEVDSVRPGGAGRVAAPIETCSTDCPMTTFNLADLFEASVDAYGDREYLVAAGERRTYAQMEERANRVAHYLAAQGIGPGDHVGIYSLNSVEWVETAWAVFKLRAVWININYRYVKDELRYLFTNADLVALVHQAEFSPQVTELLPDLPDLRLVIGVEDGSGVPLGAGTVPYEEALSEGGPERDFGPRSSDDHYILYTGGTTGMPKGVVWRHEDVFYALGGGLDPSTNTRIQRPEEMVEKGRSGPGDPVTHRPAHARRHPVVGDGPELRRQPHHLGPEVRTPRGVAARRDGAGELGDDHRRRDGQAAHRSARRSRRHPTTSRRCWPSPRRRLCSRRRSRTSSSAHLPNIVIVDAVGSSEIGQQRHVHRDQGRHGHEERAHGQRPRATRSSSTRTWSRSFPVRAPSARSPARATSRSATTTTRLRRPRCSSRSTASAT